jgi:hypothetical protein
MLSNILHHLSLIISQDLFLPPDHSPILLFPCGHTFCKICLKTFKQKSGRKCPFCRVKIESQAINISLQNLICTANNRTQDVQPIKVDKDKLEDEEKQTE